MEKLIGKTIYALNIPQGDYENITNIFDIVYGKQMGKCSVLELTIMAVSKTRSELGEKTYLNTNYTFDISSITNGFNHIDTVKEGKTYFWTKNEAEEALQNILEGYKKMIKILVLASDGKNI